MGMFSSSYETTVGTSVSRMVKDNLIPNTAKTSTINAIFRDENIAESLLAGMAGSIGLRAERYYKYAAEKYGYGLPSGEIITAIQGKAELEAVLVSLHGFGVSIEYSRMGPLNYLHAGWLALVRDYAYDTSDNTLLVPENPKRVSLKDMNISIPKSMENTTNPKTIEKWGKSPMAGNSASRPIQDIALYSMAGFSPIIISKTSNAIEVIATAEWISGDIRDSENHVSSSIITTVNKSLDISGYDLDGDYLHAKFSIGGKAWYFLYRLGTGTYPTLDALINTKDVATGEYFPFLYFRYNKQSDLDNKDVAEYKQSKKMAKMLGINYTDIAEAINENPDVADVEQAMLIFAVPAKSDNALESAYLYEYHEKLYYASPEKAFNQVSASMNNLFARGIGPLLPSNAHIIKDKRFKMVLSNVGIFKKRVGGTIGALGFCNSALSSNTISFGAIETFDGTSTKVTKKFTYPVHVYKKQISQSFYDEVEVHNMNMAYYIWGDYTDIGDKAEPILLVPLDITITKDLSLKDKEELYSRSLHYVFNSRVVTKVRWYEKSWFQFVLIVVSVVILAVTGVDTLTSLMGQLAAGTITLQAMIISLALDVFQSLLFKLALTEVVKAIGLETAFLIALVGLVAGMAIKFDFVSLPGAPWASDLLQLSTGLSSTINSVVSDGMAELQKEMTSFESYTKELAESMKTGQDLLDTSRALSPLIIFGETPAQFYERTIHSGNIGLKAIDAIHSYVDINLRLPTINDTLGAITDGV